MNFRKISVFLLLLVAGTTAHAQDVESLGIYGIDIQKIAEHSMTVSMTVDPAKIDLTTDKMLRVVPTIRSIDGDLSLPLDSFAMAGRNQYYHAMRNDNSGMPVWRAGKEGAKSYSASVPWQEWMDNCRIDFSVRTSACCGTPVTDEEIPVAQMCYVEPPMDLETNYIQPVAVREKTYKLEERAYVNFPVNRTEIYPDYMNNPAELRKITNSIDTVRDNPDATIQSITLTGYASPEGAYSNNVRLAKGRTEAVRHYVSRLYDFPSDVYICASVPEDWDGLREAIEKSDLPQRDKMIGFIDSGYPVEQRNDKFRAMFPQDYKWLLANVYPWLRHTDYLINYTIRHYTDVEEIKQVMKTRPQNLSLDEIYLVAQSYPVGSKEYDEVFDVAVHLFPENETANLNAAYSAMNRGDLQSAEKYLAKAGAGAEAEYARGVFFSKTKKYDKAESHFRKAGTPKALRAIDRMKAAVTPQGVVFVTQEPASTSQK